MTPTSPGFDRWLADVEARHLRDMTPTEVARALRALSSTYVERRRRLGEGAALDGAGKRAAFALFYAPLHFLVVRAVVHALPGTLRPRAEAVLRRRSSPDKVSPTGTDDAASTRI